MPARYRVFADDNFHYRDEEERHLAGEFDTEAEALTAARGIVDASLRDLHQPGMTPEMLMEQYVFFGEDPFIVPANDAQPFSARDYARQRCAAICG